MKLTDNELEQEKFIKEVLEYKDKMKVQKKLESEITRHELQEKVQKFENKRKILLAENAKLWKKRRNRRDYLLHHRKNIEKIEAICDEIFYLEYGMKKYGKEAYRTPTNTCYFMNNEFKDCAKHHVDKNTILCIPSDLHLSISHNLKTGRGMREMNAEAFRWLRHNNNER